MYESRGLDLEIFGFGGLAVFGPVRNFESAIAISGQLIADHVRTNVVLSGT